MSKPFNPKTTTFTNEMLDIIMPSVPPNAWKILCFAMRKTAGWQDLSTASGRKESDIISLSQFMEGCGIDSEHTVMDAIEFCLQAGYLLRFGGGQGKAYRYQLNTDYETSAENAEVDLTTSAKNAEVNFKTSADSAETNSNIINTNNNTRTKEQIIESTRQALVRGLQRQNESIADGYPADVREVLEVFNKLWKIKPPAGRKQKAFWIESSRELIEACGEFGIERVLQEIRLSFEEYMSSHHGTVPFTINSPKSLVNSARGCAGKLRVKKDEIEKPYIPHASEVWMGGVCYINGVPV